MAGKYFFQKDGISTWILIHIEGCMKRFLANNLSESVEALGNNNADLLASINRLYYR